jgi:hypothetical protein
VGLSGPARAVQNDPGYWLIFSTSDAFGSDEKPSRWHYAFDAQARYFDAGSGANQYLLRPSVGYELRGSLKAWFGFGRFRARNAAGGVTDENRWWQQLDWTAGQWDSGKLTMRARLEQRWLSNGNDTGVVLRMMAKYTRPIGAGNTNLIVALEPFWDLKDTDWGGRSRLSQNRISVALGWRASDRISFEAGYMNQYFWPTGGPNVSNHLAVFNMKAKL